MSLEEVTIVYEKGGVGEAEKTQECKVETAAQPLCGRGVGWGEPLWCARVSQVVITPGSQDRAGGTWGNGLYCVLSQRASCPGPLGSVPLHTSQSWSTWRFTRMLALLGRGARSAVGKRGAGGLCELGASDGWMTRGRGSGREGHLTCMAPCPERPWRDPGHPGVTGQWGASRGPLRAPSCPGCWERKGH